MGMFKPSVLVGSAICSVICSVVCSVGVTVFCTAVVCGQSFRQSDGQSSTGSILAAVNEGALSDEQFSQLSQFIRPSEKEDKWRETPWVPSINEGRIAAAAAGKPVFIWAMNGDPLGCV